METIRAATVHAIEVITRPLRDPLTVAGAGLISFSALMMVREPLMEAYVNHQRAVAVAKAEHEAQVAKIAALIDKLSEQRTIKADYFRTYFVDAPSSRRHDTLYVVLEDIEEQHLPMMIAHLESCGVDVNRILSADPSLHFAKLFPMNVNGHSRNLVMEPSRYVISDWNRTHWDDESVQVDERVMKPQERIAWCAQHFDAENDDNPDDVVILRDRLAIHRDGKETSSYYDYIRREAKGNPAFVRITTRQPWSEPPQPLTNVIAESEPQH